MNLGWLLSPKVVSVPERKAWLIPHKHSRLLIEWVEILIIIKLGHLLLHVLLMGFFLTHVSLRLLVVVHSASRLAPSVATIIVGGWKHRVFLLLFFSIVRGSPLSLFIRHINKIIINDKFEINSSKFEILKSLLTLSELFLFFF